MKKIILIILALVIFSSWVYAVECGSVPTDGCVVTQDTTFETGTYYLPNGIEINGNYLTLDCNNTKLIGSGSGLGTNPTKGIYNTLYSYRNQIKNCIVENYYVGIIGVRGGIIEHNILVNNSLGLHLSGWSNEVRNNVLEENNVGMWINTRYNNIYGNVINNSNNGIILTSSRNNNLYDNDISNSKFDGMRISFAFDNNVYGNTFVNSGYYGPTLADYYSIYVSYYYPYVTNSNNKIYNNKIYNKDIFDMNESVNIYCYEGVDNNYFENAKGPLCYGGDKDNDGILNFEDICPIYTKDTPLTLGCDCNDILKYKQFGGSSGQINNGCSKGTVKNFEENRAWVPHDIDKTNFGRQEISCWNEGNITICDYGILFNTDLITGSGKEITNLKYLGKLEVYIDGEFAQKYNWHGTKNENGKSSMEKSSCWVLWGNGTFEYYTSRTKSLNGEIQFVKGEYC